MAAALTGNNHRKFNRAREGEDPMVRNSSLVLIAGGGVAALEAALALRALAEDRVGVELLAPEPQFWYRPLAVAEPFDLGEVRQFELSELAAAAGATLSPGALIRVDAGRKQVETSAGSSIPYDVLLVACGAVPTPAVPGALTFRGPADTEKIRRLLDELVAGQVGRVAFVVPWGAVWSLPIYELALMTAAYIAQRELDHVELTIVTPEDEPLQLFGRAGSDAVRELLEERGIALQTGAFPIELVEGELRLVPEGSVAADRVVALPRLRGPRIDGLPQTVDGFITVDAHGQVHGLADVFAAGDITSFPVKQGGIAAQQADAAAEMIAANAGADLAPQPFRPVLRGLLLTGRQPRYLRHELTGGAGDASAASPEPLWWPPAKIVGRYLAPFLGAFAGVESPPEAPAAPGAVPVEVELARERIDALPAVRLEVGRAAEGEDGPTAADAMSTEPLVVAPEETLGEVAEKMRERDLGSALVADYGRLIGILTSRDLLRAFAGRVHPSEARVREWMTAEPITVPAAAPLDAAVTLMTEYGFHHLPVVEDERPVGMLGLRQAAGQARPRTGIGLGF
jgi:sulfide:quinone oxidoreductase